MHRPRILIVDDDPMIRDMLSRNLEDCQYEVQAVGDGDAFLQIAMQETPDLVLLDTSMPDCSSLDIARRLRMNPTTAGVPIIALTSFEPTNGGGAWQLNGHAEDIQVDDYAAKPFCPDLLLSKVREVLEQNSG